MALMDHREGAIVMDRFMKSSIFDGRARVITVSPDCECLDKFDRILVLDEGRVTVQGTSAEVLKSTAFKTVKAKSQATLAPKTSAVALANQPHLLDGGALPSEVKETQGYNKWSAIAETACSGGPKRLVAATAVVLVLRACVMGQVLLLGIWADSKDSMMHDELGEASPVHDSYYVHMMAFGIILAAGLQAIQNYLVLSFNSTASKTLFNQAFSSLLRAPVDSFWGKQPVGRVVNRLSADVLTIDASFSTGFLALSGFIFSVVVQQIYCLVVMPKWLVLPMYLSMASFAIFCWSASTPLQYFSMMALSKCHDDNVYASKTAVSSRAYRQQGRQVTRYCAQASAVVKPNFLGVACAKQWLVFRITFCFCFQCTVCMLCGIMRPSGVHIGTLAMIALSTFNIIQELDGFIDTLINSISVGISFQRLTEYFRRQRALPKEEHDHRDAIAKGHAQTMLLEGVGLTVEALTIGYTGRLSDAVAGVNLQLAAGSWLGVVGPAGSGKSCLLMGLAQLVDPRSGHAKIGNVDLKDCAQGSPELLRRMVHYVPQEPAIFTGSIRFNVDPSGQHSDEHILEALKKVQIGGAVHELYNGLDTMISSDNCFLSSSQQQLLCLARSIVDEPSLLLLDNSLSAVDRKTQEAACSNIAQSYKKTAVIFASRRAECILNFDQAIVLDNGVVIEQGPVPELLKKGKGYLASCFSRY